MNYKRNAEGYIDPTAGTAMERIMCEERKNRIRKRKPYRPLVYICSPYAGDVERNVNNARSYCRFAVNKNCIPVASHLLYPQFLDDRNQKERELGLFFGKVLMDKCDEVWIFSDGTYSKGMTDEKDRAIKRGYKIKYFTTDCREVVDVGIEGDAFDR